MKLGEVDFGRLWNSSGARGFFGEPDEYWYHKYWRLAGLDYTGITFVAKTTTTLPRTGNMALDGRWRPRHRRPKCIVVKFRQGVVLNAVGLSGPGAMALLDSGKYFSRTEPFVLSWMPTGIERWEMVADAKAYAARMARYCFKAPAVALEVNYSCPNVAHGSDHVTIIKVLEALKERIPNISLIPKFNALEPIATAVEVSRSDCCDAVLVGNTIPWGQRPDVIPWGELFGTNGAGELGISPLWEYGGGGLSGWPLLPLTIDWVSRARHVVQKPIIAGGGIMSARDATSVLAAGAAAVEVGVVGVLRPWRMRSIREAVNGTTGDIGAVVPVASS